MASSCLTSISLRDWKPSFWHVRSHACQVHVKYRSDCLFLYPQRDIQKIQAWTYLVAIWLEHTWTSRLLVRVLTLARFLSAKELPHSLHDRLWRPLPCALWSAGGPRFLDFAKATSIQCHRMLQTWRTENPRIRYDCYQFCDWMVLFYLEPSCWVFSQTIYFGFYWLSPFLVPCFNGDSRLRRAADVGARPFGNDQWNLKLARTRELFTMVLLRLMLSFYVNWAVVVFSCHCHTVCPLMFFVASVDDDDDDDDDDDADANYSIWWNL